MNIGSQNNHFRDIPTYWFMYAQLKISVVKCLREKLFVENLTKTDI